VAKSEVNIDIRREAIRHASAIHNYLRRRAGSDVADDLLGEVWIRAFAERTTFDPERGPALPWLLGIARNVLRMYWHQQGRQVAPTERSVTDPWIEVDDRLDQLALREKLVSSLDKLTPEEREVLLLVSWEQLSQHEVAIVLGIPNGTVRSRLHRARMIMRAAIADSDVSINPAARRDT
jgi:RNA polymerase sigma factor (sigma-70 family)